MRSHKPLIHKAGKFKDGIQTCELCGCVIFSLVEKDPKMYKAPARVHHITNSTTKPIQISPKGWTKGIHLKISPNKIEVTKEKPTCK